MRRLARSRGQSPELEFGAVTTSVKGKKGSCRVVVVCVATVYVAVVPRALLLCVKGFFTATVLEH